MDTNLDIQIEQALKAYLASGVEDQVYYQKFYLYSIVTHSTAIEGSTVTEIENQLLFDEGIAAKGRSLTEQMMNVDLKDAYLYAFRIAADNPTYTPQLLQQLSALVMRRTGSEYSTIAGHFDSSKGEFRLCNVSAGIGGRSYLAYNKVPRAVDDFCRWLNEEIANADRANIAACYRLSFEAHFRLVTIHPWVDGNGRTARLLMNIIQRQLGLVPEISKFLEHLRANLRYETDFEWLFQQSSIVVAPFKYAHLMDGDLVELDQALPQWHTMFNKHRIEILHVGEAYKFIDRGVIPDISFEVGIGFSPLFCCHAEHSHIQHIGFIGIYDTRLSLCNLGRYEIMLDGIGVDTIVYLGQLTFRRPAD